MNDIDFLPADFRRRHAKRNTHLWRLGVVVAVGLLVSSTALAQHRRWRQANDAMAATNRVHDETMREVQQLGRLQLDGAAAEEEAQLIAYLLHPWPRTRILATVLQPLPDEIALEKIAIDQTLPPGQAATGAVTIVDPKAEEQRVAGLSPAARDLETFRRQMDRRQTVVTLSGETTRPETVHRYLDLLARSKLVAKAELDSLETADTDAIDKNVPEGPMTFSATIVIRPGYGQPGGPTGSASAVAGATPYAPHAPGDDPS
ncbi:MAG: hypothetical protein JW809_14195 [Pirellulales bacterium]|nr:hypothetical protein [Pirellulales bacterium]